MSYHRGQGRLAWHRRCAARTSGRHRLRSAGGDIIYEGHRRDGGLPAAARVSMSIELPILSLAPLPERLPHWLKKTIPAGGGGHLTAQLVEELHLETVCTSAKCPNRMECWSQRTATFMILGNTCTRPCGFCSVPKGKTAPLEIDEPDRVAEAALRLGLKHGAITSVSRDDLPAAGAETLYPP